MSEASAVGSKITDTMVAKVRASRNGQSWIGAGYYDDECVKGDRKWKFHSHRYQFIFLVPLHEGWAEQAA